MRKIFSPLFIVFALLFSCQSFAQEEKDISMLLGGMIKSDKWIIRKDAMEEEFKGHVRYENERYKLQADKALSKRKEKKYELTGNVLLARKDKDTTLTLTAARVSYDQNKDTGFATAAKKKQIKVVYVTPENTYTLLADKVEFSKEASFCKATGNVKITDKENSLKAQSATFDRISGIFEALPRRPQVSGQNEDGSYALEADKIIVDTKNGTIRTIGNSQGWLTLKKDLLTEENLKKLKE